MLKDLSQTTGYLGIPLPRLIGCQYFGSNQSLSLLRFEMKGLLAAPS
jgi:hypothetical protein